MTWTIAEKGSWAVASTDDPGELPGALGLPGSWRWHPRHAAVLVRRDQVGTLTGSAPVLNGINPGFGPVDGGTPCSLGGLRLTGTTMVFFASNQATDVQVVDDSSITVTSPAKADGQPGLVNVNVIRGIASNAVQFDYR